MGMLERELNKLFGRQRPARKAKPETPRCDHIPDPKAICGRNGTCSTCGQAIYEKSGRWLQGTVSQR